jgi:hypothetical protein
VPKYRSQDYTSLDAVNEAELDRFVKYSIGEFDHRNEASFLPFVSTLRSLDLGRATFFLEREFTDPLLHSKFGNLQVSDICWRLNYSRIVVALGTLSVPQTDGIHSITSFSIARIKPGDVVGCPVEIGREIDNFVSRVWHRPNLSRLEHLNYQFSRGGFILAGTSDRAESYARFLEDNQTNNVPSSGDEGERALLVKLEQLAWNTLIFLGLVPLVEYEPEHVEPPDSGIAPRTFPRRALLSRHPPSSSPSRERAPYFGAR